MCWVNTLLTEPHPQLRLETLTATQADLVTSAAPPFPEVVPVFRLSIDLDPMSDVYANERENIEYLNVYSQPDFYFFLNDEATLCSERLLRMSVYHICAVLMRPEEKGRSPWK